MVSYLHRPKSLISAIPHSIFNMRSSYSCLSLSLSSISRSAKNGMRYVGWVNHQTRFRMGMLCRLVIWCGVAITLILTKYHQLLIIRAWWANHLTGLVRAVSYGAVSSGTFFAFLNVMAYFVGFIPFLLKTFACFSTIRSPACIKNNEK